MKYRVLILILVLALSVLCSCQPQHTHSFAPEYVNDDTHHWRECECGAKHWNAEHEWDEGVITLHPTQESEGSKTLTCKVCDFVKEEVIEKLPADHEHTYDISNSNEYTHWNECICGEKQNEVAHTWNQGAITTPADEIVTGIKTFACTDCGHRLTENIPSIKPNGLSFTQNAHYRLSDKLAATPLTIEAEIYVDPSITGRAGAVFGNYYGIREDWLLEIHENGIPRFYYSDSSGNVRDLRFKNVDVRTGDWAHIALTFDFEERIVSFYLNGEIVEILTCEFDLADDITRYQFVLGGDNRSNNGIYFKGQIRSIAAYSDVRNAEEIARSAQKGINLYADDLLVAYMLNEKSAGKDIKDLSGNGYIIQKEWLDSNEVELDYAYSFAVVGDTQWLSRYKPEKMEKLYDWLVANANDKKIAHVFGLGDITDAWNTADKENEWIRAQQYISKLNGVVPYSLVRGNHDESKYFLKYFANETYMSQFDGFMVDGDIRNSYREFKIGTTDYLFLSLDYGASDEILEWANEIVLKYPNHRVIVTTHAYHGYDGGRLNPDNVSNSGNITPNTDVDASVGDNTGRNYNNGQGIWEKFVSLHPNIFLVMSGHTPLEDVFVLQTEGVHGNIVTQMLIDPQWMDPQKDGVGMVCMLYFSEDGTQMEVEWISTDTGKYYKEQNQFALDFTECLKGTKHDFQSKYNEECHYLECKCGFAYGETTHIFDGGVLDASGFMEYTCNCGYKKITSASEDPTAIALQELIAKFYNDGKYFRNTNVNGENTTSFFDGNIFWTADPSDYEIVDPYITLYEIIMGKFGDLRVDLGWSYYDGVYSSTNADTIRGIRNFALSMKKSDGDSSITKVTIEEDGAVILIQLWANDTVVTETKVGLYATINLVDMEGKSLGVHYVEFDEKGVCKFTPPEISGLIAEYDSLMLYVRHSTDEKTVHYSELDIWDGTSVSESLFGMGTAESPFLIQSGADLAYVAKVVNDAVANTVNFKGAYFKMTKSIDLSGNELMIGSYSASKAFHGFFDGNNCSVRGINATQSLFGMLKDGYIKNLSVYGKVTTTEKKGVAGLVSYISNSTVENISNYVEVTGVQQVAGIVGWLENTTEATIKNCVNYGTIKATSYQNGGIAGFAKGNIIDCANYGDVSSSASGYVGGIGGSANDSKGVRSNCVNYGNISGTNYIGGAFGTINKTTTDCFSYGTTHATGQNVGDVVGGGASYLVYSEE